VTNTPTATPTHTPVPNGGACDDGADCLSGNCVDDTCCAEPACPPGQSCDNPGHAGECSLDPAEPAPALSRGAVLFAAVLLLVLGGVAMRRRRRGA
jgi:MYXO-CTERM domain-containing protein